MWNEVIIQVHGQGKWMLDVHDPRFAKTILKYKIFNI